MMKHSNSPGWLRAVAAMALLWNLFGLLAWFAPALVPEQLLGQLPATGRMLLEAGPAWARNAFLLTVASGAFGALLLLTSSRLAVLMLGVSVLALLAQTVHVLITRSGSTGTELLLTGLIVGFYLFVWLLSAQARNQAWLR